MKRVWTLWGKQSTYWEHCLHSLIQFLRSPSATWPTVKLFLSFSSVDKFLLRVHFVKGCFDTSFTACWHQFDAQEKYLTWQVINRPGVAGPFYKHLCDPLIDEVILFLHGTYIDAWNLHGCTNFTKIRRKNYFAIIKFSIDLFKVLRKEKIISIIYDSVSDKGWKIGAQKAYFWCFR